MRETGARHPVEAGVSCGDKAGMASFILRRSRHRSPGPIFCTLLLSLSASCAAPALRAPMACDKDYAAIRVRDLATMEESERLQEQVGNGAQLSVEQQETVRRARELRQSRSLVADDTDVAIIDRARSILRNDTLWDRADDRECAQGDTRFSLFCALYFASREVDGRYRHRRTALQEVRFAVEEATRGRAYEHRLRDFNNDPATRLQDLYAVLATARSRLIERLEDQRLCRL